MSNRRLTETHIDYIIGLERSGRTTAEAILADAKQPASPLHNLYDWDVQKAAEAHWLDRTREIIRLVKIVVHSETVSVKLPRYIRDPQQPANEQGYATLETIRVDPVLAKRALIAEFERVTGALRRARSIAIGLEMEDAVTDLIERVVGLRTLLAETEPSSAATIPAGGAESLPV